MMYRNAVRGRPRQATGNMHKIWRSSAVWFSSYASGQTDIFIIAILRAVAPLPAVAKYTNH